MSIDNKLAAMILFFTNKEQVSRTALNKLLFFADIYSYLTRGEPISSSLYLKLQFGPVPQNIDTLRTILIFEDYLIENQVATAFSYSYYYSASQNVSWEKVYLLFSEEELKILGNIKEKLIKLSASELTKKSHQFEPWKSSDWLLILDFDKAKNDDNLIGWLKN